MKFAEMIVLLGIFVVLPIIIVAIVARAKTNATNKRAQIALAAIEKNSDVDLEDFFTFLKKEIGIDQKDFNQWMRKQIAKYTTQDILPLR